MKKKIVGTVAVLAATVLLSAGSCDTAADTANRNLSEAAENFEVPRRIVGINTIKGDVLFSVEGFCSYEVNSQVIEAVCLEDRATGRISRTTLGKADNVTFVSTQMRGVEVDLFRPRVILRPEGLLPNFDLSTSDNPTEP